MKDPFTILRAVIAVILVGITTLTAESQSTSSSWGDREKRPHWFPPLAQFGTYGFSSGEFLGPRSVALGANREIFVADTGNHRIQKFTLEGQALDQWGHRGSKPGEFLFPLALASRSETHELFVLDAGNHRVQVFTAEGSFLREWSIAGFLRFMLNPGASIATSKCSVLIADPQVPKIQKYSFDGTLQDTLVVKGGGADALGTPSGIAVDPEDHVYVADARNHRIHKLDLSGKLLAEWGGWGPYQGFLETPQGLAFAAGRLLVCDSANHRIQVFGPSGGFLAQWGGPIRWPGDGRGLFHSPSAIAVDLSGGRVVLCEPLEHRCQVFSLDNPHELNPVFKSWLIAATEDHHHPSESRGLPAAPAKTRAKESGEYAWILDEDASALLVYDLASRSPFPLARMGRPGIRLGELSLACAMAMDTSGKRAYVLDAGNQRVQVFELSPLAEPRPSGTTFLKAIGAMAPFRKLGTEGSETRGEPSLDALCVDADGNLWTLDAQNAAVHQFDSHGRGIGDIRLHGGPPDGSCNPVGLAVGPTGKKIYILDQCRSRVLAYEPDGDFAFSWGGRDAADENGFQCPAGIVADANGILYVVDAGVHAIKKFDTRGTFIGQWGKYGSKAGELSSPRGIWLMGRDRIIIDDTGNHRGQVFTLQGAFVSQLAKGAIPSPQ